MDRWIGFDSVLRSDRILWLAASLERMAQKAHAFLTKGNSQICLRALETAPTNPFNRRKNTPGAHGSGVSQTISTNQPSRISIHKQISVLTSRASQI